jgi:hypothetical protein
MARKLLTVEADKHECERYDRWPEESVHVDQADRPQNER